MAGEARHGGVGRGRAGQGLAGSARRGEARSGLAGHGEAGFAASMGCGARDGFRGKNVLFNVILTFSETIIGAGDFARVNFRLRFTHKKINVATLLSLVFGRLRPRYQAPVAHAAWCL